MNATSTELDRRLPAALAQRGEITATAVACRALDLVLGATLLVLLLPLFVLIAVAIRLDSPGNVVFSQRRFGRGMAAFTMYKFRTMQRGGSADRHREYVIDLIHADRIASSNGSGALYKLRDDERVTRVGRLLRRMSLDELPQLWNVVRGQMSLVGPRPVIPYEVEHYPPDWCERFTVSPGLTGLWQVSGRNRLTYAQMVDLDVEYARRRSFWLNVVILVRTPWVIAQGKDVA
jgi:lipopolysaccharide/colanic/teichoic acid biosynthesis glycosyltransferase